MTMTDDELTGLLATQFGKGSLRVGLEQVERRGRQRRRRARVAVAAAVLAVLAGAGGYGIDRQQRADELAAFNRGCQTIYTAEAAKTLRADQLPAALGTPLLELRRGEARFRLYTSPPGPLRSMTFDCSRTAEGAVSGRISYGPPKAQELDKPIVVYRDQLPDGSTAIVARLRDPLSTLIVTPTSPEVQIAQRAGVTVIWGPRALLASAKLTAGDAIVDLARDPLAITATFQEPEFAAYCQRVVNGRPALSGARQILTIAHGDHEVKAVYLAPQGLALCSWHNLPDDPDIGLSYHGPALQAGSMDNANIGTIVAMSDLDGSHTWMAGATPPGTVRVEIGGGDGSVTEARLGDGAFLARVPGSERFAKITLTTATTVYTVTEGKVTDRPR